MKCPRCNGTGRFKEILGPLWWQVREWRCAACGGSGEVKEKV